LVRRFGEDWYMELEKVAEELKNNSEITLSRPFLNFYISRCFSGLCKTKTEL
jgi:hypothetical protein